MDPNDPQFSAEFEALRARVSQLEQERRPRRFGPAVLLAAVTVATIGVTWAANGECRQGMPWCFTGNSPAMAGQVNDNFTYLHDAITTKVGSIDAGTITATGNLALNNGQFVGTNASGNFHINTMPANGRLYLNWHTGTGGVIFGNGAAGQAAAMSAGGDLSLASINGRRPAVSNATNCTGGNCTASCTNSGVIRQAWGFHGNNWNAEIGGGWVCGSGIEWLGNCIGASSCTVTTGCGTSSIWIDCW